MAKILTDQEMLVVCGARDGLSYDEIAASIGRSKARVQILIQSLKAEGYLEHQRYKHRSLTLTDKAKKYLATNNMRNE